VFREQVEVALLQFSEQINPFHFCYIFKFSLNQLGGFFDILHNLTNIVIGLKINKMCIDQGSSLLPPLCVEAI